MITARACLFMHPQAQIQISSSYKKKGVSNYLSRQKKEMLCRPSREHVPWEEPKHFGKKPSRFETLSHKLGS